MSIVLKNWHEVESRDLEKLFLDNRFPLYHGTPIAGDSMKRHMYQLARESAKENGETAKVALAKGRPIATGQLYSIPYLTDFWGISIGSIGHMVVEPPAEEESYHAANLLVKALVKEAGKRKMVFLSTSIPGPSISLGRALEENGFRYAEGFINWVGPTHKAREKFLIPNLKIREIREDDFNCISEAYFKVEFPSRFVTDGGFDKEKAKELYVRRFQEVYERKLGKIFVAEFDGNFAGAIIAIVDERMAKKIGIKTNALSGMGIIVHPKATRRGVALALIEYRQSYYKSKGVEYVNFGANLSNFPMIRGLEKLGLRFGSVDVTFHKWLNE